MNNMIDNSITFIIPTIGRKTLKNTLMKKSLLILITLLISVNLFSQKKPDSSAPLGLKFIFILKPPVSPEVIIVSILRI